MTIDDKQKERLKGFADFTDEDFELLTEEDTKHIITEVLKDNPSALKPIKLKQIKVFGNKIVKTVCRVESIETGINLILGFEYECPHCHGKQTCYNPYLKDTSSNGWYGCLSDPCVYVGSRGAIKHHELDKKCLNSTGFRALVVDTDVASGNSTQYSIFFPLDILPKNEKDLEKFELQIQMNPIEITGIIRVKQSQEQNISDWFIEVTDFKIIKKTYDYDKNLLHHFGSEIKRDDKFFQDYYAQKVLKKELQKKCHALVLLSPHKISLPSGDETKATTVVLEAGDPGQSKTSLANEGFIKYSEDRSNFIYVENSSAAGLILKTQKSKNGKWIVSLGELPKSNMGGCVLDGFGKLDQDTLAELRSIEEEGICESNKVSGHFSIVCLVNQIQLANVKNHIAEYPTKHKASFDLAINTSDFSGKFDGADRRRKCHVIISSNQDIPTNEVTDHLVNYKKNNFDDVAYWSNLNKFAWTRDPKQIIWSEGVEAEAQDKVKQLNQLFSDFELYYGILGKGGLKMFLRQLPSVAILHESIQDENVIIEKEHTDWLFNLYQDEFKDLGLYNEKETDENLLAHANGILDSCDPEVLQILKWLFEYGSQSKIEEKNLMGRMTIFRKLKPIVTYRISCKSKNEKGEIEETFFNFAYSFHEGSGHTVPSSNPFKPDFEADFEISSLNKRDGTLTGFGKILTRLASERIDQQNDTLDTLKKGGL